MACHIAQAPNGMAGRTKASSIASRFVMRSGVAFGRVGHLIGRQITMAGAARSRVRVSAMNRWETGFCCESPVSGGA